jgi:hypothetical protein
VSGLYEQSTSGFAFMPVIAYVYCPAYLEHRLLSVKKKGKSLYNATALIFSNFQPTAQAIFSWVLERGGRANRDYEAV